MILRKRNNLNHKNPNLVQKSNIHIYALPFLSVLCAVLGGLLSRIVFLKSNLSPIHTTEIRLLGAILFLVILKKFKINFYFRKLEKKQKKKIFTFNISWYKYRYTFAANSFQNSSNRSRLDIIKYISSNFFDFCEERRKKN